MSRPSFAPVIALAAASVAVSSSNAAAAREQSRYNGAINSEFDSLASVISKKKEFREAANEMLNEIGEIAGVPRINGPQDMKVGAHLFSFSKTDVPIDVAQWATRTAKEQIEGDLKEFVTSLRGEFLEIASNGLYEDMSMDELVYNKFEGVLFHDAIDEKGLAAIARNGVAIAVQDYLDQDTKPGIFGVSKLAKDHSEKSTTIQAKRALTLAINGITDSVCENIEKVREKDLEVITKQSPAYEPA